MFEMSAKVRFQIFSSQQNGNRDQQQFSRNIQYELCSAMDDKDDEMLGGDVR